MQRIWRKKLCNEYKDKNRIHLSSLFLSSPSSSISPTSVLLYFSYLSRLLFLFLLFLFISPLASYLLILWPPILYSSHLSGLHILSPLWLLSSHLSGLLSSIPLTSLASNPLFLPPLSSSIPPTSLASYSYSSRLLFLFLSLLLPPIL